MVTSIMEKLSFDYLTPFSYGIYLNDNLHSVYVLEENAEKVADYIWNQLLDTDNSGDTVVTYVNVRKLED